VSRSLSNGLDGALRVPQRHYTCAHEASQQDEVANSSSENIAPSRTLDYWRLTHADADPVAVLARISRWLDVEFREVGGSSFFRRGAVAYKGCIRVCWDNANAPRTVMVEFTGEAMRYIESREEFAQGWNWRRLMHSWSCCGWRCRRLDIAIDDRAYRVPWDVPYQHVTGRHVTCRALRGDVDGYEVRMKAAGGHLARTLYVGSRQGDNFLRIYEKGRQMGEETPWCRFELEIKHDRAELAMQTFIARGEDALYGMMRSFIEFKEVTQTTVNRTRQVAASWWEDLVRTSKLVVNIPGRVAAKIEKLVRHVDHQWGPNIAAITEALGGSVDWIYEILERGKGRLKSHHRELVAAFDDGSGARSGKVGGQWCTT